MISIRLLPSDARRPAIRATLQARRALFSLPLAAYSLTTASGGVRAAQATSAPDPDGRVALVIGNAAYPDAPLRNPVNDARALARTLRPLGFEVTVRENVDFPEMRAALRQFVLKQRSAAVRLIFFAGHGLQLRGRSYLLPIGAPLRNETDIVERTADATELVEQLSAIDTGANVVIIDACRVHPVFSAGSRRMWAAKPGLSKIAAPSGTVVAFSTRPGQVALDGGGPGANANASASGAKASRGAADRAAGGRIDSIATAGSVSVYTRHLTATLQASPSWPVEAVFKRVRQAVMAETGNRQVPWESSDLNGELCFLPDAQGRCQGRP